MGSQRGGGKPLGCICCRHVLILNLSCTNHCSVGHDVFCVNGKAQHHLFIGHFLQKSWLFKIAVFHTQKCGFHRSKSWLLTKITKTFSSPRVLKESHIFFLHINPLTPIFQLKFCGQKDFWLTTNKRHKSNAADKDDWKRGLRGRKYSVLGLLETCACFKIFMCISMLCWEWPMLCYMQSRR